MRTLDRSWTILSFTAVLIANLLLPQSASAAATERKVLIIGIDGCRPDALQTANTPHIDGLVVEGAVSYEAQVNDRTKSGPGWSSMLTGVWRNKHGVATNDYVAPNFDRYPHFFTRLKEHDPDAYTASIVRYGGINNQILSDADSARWLWWNDRRAVYRGVIELRKPHLDCLFVHLDDVDGAGHDRGYGPEVPEYIEAIETADANVGILLEALHARPTFGQEDWLILVSTDHGGVGTGHGADTPLERTIFVIVSGPSALRGRIHPAPGVVDIAATALVHLGVRVQSSWKLDGVPVGLAPRPGNLPQSQL